MEGFGLSVRLFCVSSPDYLTTVLLVLVQLNSIAGLSLYINLALSFST